MLRNHPLSTLDISRITANDLWQACVVFSAIEFFAHVFDEDAVNIQGGIDVLYASGDEYWENLGFYWDGVHWEAEGHCCIIGDNSDLAVLWFESNEVVGAFFWHEDADRSPYAKDIDFTFDYHDVWRGMPDRFWPIVEQELVPRMTFPREVPRPAISGGLWSEGGYLRTAESWPDEIEHGVWILQHVLWYADRDADREAIFAKMATFFELADSQIAAVRSYLARRLATPPGQPAYMTPEEIRLALIK